MSVAAIPASARRRRLVVYGLGLALLAFAALTLIEVVLRVPTRVGDVELAGQRVRIALALEPDPPRTGAILARVTITDESGNPAPADEVALGYGADGRTGRRVAASPLASVGLYQGRVEFTDVGAAWVEVALRRGGAWARVRFPVDVRPNM